MLNLNIDHISHLKPKKNIIHIYLIFIYAYMVCISTKSIWSCDCLRFVYRACIVIINLCHIYIYIKDIYYIYIRQIGYIYICIYKTYTVFVRVKIVKP